MKIGFILVFFISSFTASFSQENSNTTPGQEVPGAAANINDLELRSFRPPSLAEIGGSIYLTGEYQTATVKLKNGATATSIPVKFNIYNNLVVVQRSGEELKLESFESVSYDQVTTAGSKHIVFKSGYPEIDNHLNTSVYQVLAEGVNIHLLKYFSQKVEDAPTLGDYSRRELVTTQQLYVYTTGGEIKKIGLGRKAITDALPSFSAKADEIIKSKGLNLKNEADFVTMVEELNKQ